MLGLSETAAGTRLHRTLTKLRKACNDAPTTPPRSSATWPRSTPRWRRARPAHDDPLARELQELALALRADAPAAATPRSPRSCASAWSGLPARSTRTRAPAARVSRPPRWRGLRRRPPAGARTRLLLPVAGVACRAADRGGDHRRRRTRRAAVTTAAAVRTAAATPPSAAAARRAAAARPPRCPGLPGEVTAQRRRRRHASQLAQPCPAAASPPGQRNRKIERSFSLELDVPLDEMARVADDVTAVTNRHGGFVLDSSVRLGRGRRRRRLLAAHPRRSAAPGAARPRRARPGDPAEPGGPRRHARARDRQGPPAGGTRRAAQPAAPARGGRRRTRRPRRSGAGSTWSAGEINGLRGQLRDLRLRTDYAVVTVSLLVGDEDDGGGAWAARSTTRSTTPATCWSASRAC